MVVRTAFFAALSTAFVLATPAIVRADEKGHFSVDAACADRMATPQRGFGSETKIDASLPVTNPWWLGSAGAPNGFTLGLFGFRTTLPRSITKDVTSTYAAPGARFDVDAASLHGATLAGGYVHRFFVALFDLSVGGGTAPAIGRHADGTRESFDASMMAIETSARVGVRVPLHDVAFMAGTGLGDGLWIAGKSGDPGTSDFASAAKATFDLPLWASVLVKPTCDFGLEVGASYRFDPFEPADSTTSIDAGLVWEPNGGCDRDPSFDAS